MLSGPICTGYTIFIEVLDHLLSLCKCFFVLVLRIPALDVVPVSLARFVGDTAKECHLDVETLLSEVIHLNLQVWNLLYLFECNN